MAGLGLVTEARSASMSGNNTGLKLRGWGGERLLTTICCRLVCLALHKSGKERLPSL